MIELYLDTLVYMIYELDLYEYHYMTSTYYVYWKPYKRELVQYT